MRWRVRPALHLHYQPGMSNCEVQRMVWIMDTAEATIAAVRARARA